MRKLQTLLVIFMLMYNSHTARNRRLRKSVSDVDVRELEITSRVSLRYANVLVRSVMVNRKSTDQEVAFQVRLPKEAYITSFLIITNNRTIKAVIKEKKKAREEFDEAKKNNVTAGLVSQQSVRDDLDVDIFQIEVNVAANTEVEFQLEYEEFLKRHASKYTQALFIDSEHVIPKLVVNCSFKERQKFKLLSFKTPYGQHKMSSGQGIMTDDGYHVKTIDWQPNDIDQNSATTGLEAPFEIEYELEIDETGGMIFFNNEGDFVHIFSVPCDESKIMAKQIVFVIDISGSMNGNPISQVRLAMMSILAQLRMNDFFNIVIFDDISAKWKTMFQQANADNVNEARLFVQEKVKADGSTNINDALLQAIDLFDNAGERFGQIVVFLTDGSPTAGVTNTDDIRKNVRARNYIGGDECCKTTINTIAFGRHAGISFLQKIAYENAGTLTIIKEIESSVADGELIAMYEDIKNPIYKNLVFSFEVDNEVLPESNVTRTQFLQYDCGSEIVISGWTLPGEKINPTVKVVGVQADDVFTSVPTVLIFNSDSEMLSRLVAYQWVKELFRKVDTTSDAEVKYAANEKALELSLQYGFVTPLTSLVVTDYQKTDDGPSGSFESFDYAPSFINNNVKKSSFETSSCPKFSSDQQLYWILSLLVSLFLMSKTNANIVKHVVV